MMTKCVAAVAAKVKAAKMRVVVAVAMTNACAAAKKAKN